MALNILVSLFNLQFFQHMGNGHPISFAKWLSHRASEVKCYSYPGHITEAIV